MNASIPFVKLKPAAASRTYKSQPRQKKKGHDMEMTKLLSRAQRQLTDVTGFKPLAVTHAVKDAKGWHVGIELIEMARIPSASDLLGYYEVLLDKDANMVRFDRKRTRVRGQPMEEESA